MYFLFDLYEFPFRRIKVLQYGSGYDIGKHKIIPTQWMPNENYEMDSTQRVVLNRWSPNMRYEILTCWSSIRKETEVSYLDQLKRVAFYDIRNDNV